MKQNKEIILAGILSDGAPHEGNNGDGFSYTHADMEFFASIPMLLTTAYYSAGYDKICFDYLDEVNTLAMDTWGTYSPTTFLPRLTAHCVWRTYDFSDFMYQWFEDVASLRLQNDPSSIDGLKPIDVTKGWLGEHKTVCDNGWHQDNCYAREGGNGKERGGYLAVEALRIAPYNDFQHEYWPDNPERTSWFPSRESAMQWCKAYMGDQYCQQFDTPVAEKPTGKTRNPASSPAQLTHSSDGISLSVKLHEPYMVSITDLNGRKVYQREYRNSSRITINNSAAKVSGMCVIRIKAKHLDYSFKAMMF
jgi:hypothetical protein